jgi:murein DD-endopeptidase MepM/ murein hydrolase activator NlpD
MTNAHRDLATPELWMRSLERSRRRRVLLPKARREHNRRKHLSAALATAAVAGPAAPVAAAQVSGDLSAAVASESPANRAIEIREGGLPLQAGSQGELVAHVQRALHITADGVFGVQTDTAVRSYQRSAGLEVDGIVGLATWGALFESQSASGASMGGSNVPPEVKQKVEQRLEQAGQELSAEGEVQGGAELAAPGSGTTTPSAPDSTTSTPAPPPTGQACGSATISSPVSGTVTSEFGPRWGRNHDGVDISAPTGTPVRAAACGTVSLAGQQSGYGNMVCITHTSQFSTCYAHLSRFGVSNGAEVRQGQVIGYVGCTGSCTGPHLHFETRVGGQAQDPSAYLRGTAMPGRSANVAGTANIGGPDLPPEVLRQAAREASRTTATVAHGGGATAVVGGEAVTSAPEAATPEAETVTPETTTADGTVTYETPAAPVVGTVTAETPVAEVEVGAAPAEPCVDTTVTAPAPVEPAVEVAVAEPAPVEPAAEATVTAEVAE